MLFATFDGSTSDVPIWEPRLWNIEMDYHQKWFIQNTILKKNPRPSDQ